MNDQLQITFVEPRYANFSSPDGTVYLTVIYATVDGVETCIPLDPANRHYAEIMRQVEEGTLTIAEAEADV